MGGGEGNDQLWGSGRGAIAGCQSVSYLPSIFKATNFTQTPKKTAMNFVLSFLQTLVTLFSTLITQTLVFAIWGLIW